MAATPPEELRYLDSLIDVDILSRHEAYIQPTDKNLNGASLTFDIKNEENYSVLDLEHVELLCEIDIFKKGTSVHMPATELKCIPSSNFLHCLFRNVEVKMNDTVVSSQDFMYSYRAYIEKATSYTPPHADLTFNKGGFIFEKGMDGMQAMTDTNPETVTVKKDSLTAADVNVAVLKNIGTGQNSADRLRQMFFKPAGGKSHQFKDYLHEIPFNQKKYLPNGVKLTVTLTRQDNKAFYLKGDNYDKYEVNVKNIFMVVPFIKLSVPAFMRIEQQISETGVKIALTRKVAVIKTLTANQNPQIIDQLFHTGSNVLPEKLYFSFMEGNQQAGVHNVFNFKFDDRKLRKFHVTLPDGKILPHVNEPDMDFSQNVTELAWDNFTKLFKLNTDGQGSVVTEDLYKSLFSLFGVQISANPSTDEIIQATGVGSITITLSFNAPGPEGGLLLVIGEFKDDITILKNKVVRVSWN
jgi:hypothetical protein